MIKRGMAGTESTSCGLIRHSDTARRFLLPLFLLGSIVISGCVTDSDLDAVRTNMAQLQLQSINRDKDLAQMKDQIANMQRDLNALTAIRESQSNLLTQTSDYSKDLQSLRGRFDENKYFMDKTIKDLTSEIELQKARVTALETQLKEAKAPQATEAKEAAKTAVPANATPNAVPVANADAEQKGPDSAAKLYDEAHIALKEKRYSDARKMFERFVKDYPKESLTPNSYFWIGESYYADKKYEDAILAYEDFLKKYPNHEKAKGAMLKQGYAFLELGDKKTGKVILETLIEKYPKSKEAELAQKKLKELSAKQTPPKSKSKKKK